MLYLRLRSIEIICSVFPSERPGSAKCEIFDGNTGASSYAWIKKKSPLL